MADQPPPPKPSPPPIDAAGVLIADWYCTRCGSNLRGRRAADPCPKCTLRAIPIAPLAQGQVAAKALNVGLAWQAGAVILWIVTQFRLCCLVFRNNREGLDAGEAVFEAMGGFLFLASALYLNQGLRHADEPRARRIGRTGCLLLAILIMVVPAGGLFWAAEVDDPGPLASSMQAAGLWLRTATVCCVLGLIVSAGASVGRRDLVRGGRILLGLIPTSWLCSHLFGLWILAGGRLMSEPGMLMVMPPSPTLRGVVGFLLAYGFPAIVGVGYIRFLMACRVQVPMPPGDSLERGPTLP